MISFQDFNEDLYDLRLGSAPFGGGLPIPKKDLQRLTVVPGEAIKLTLQTESGSKSFTVRALTNIRAGERATEKRTRFGQIAELVTSDQAEPEEIDQYINMIKVQKRKLAGISAESLTQISKDAYRTVLRISQNFATTDYFNIDNLTSFVNERYHQLNANLYSNLLNVDQLVLQYFVFDVLHMTTQLLGDYQQGYNDIAGFVISLLIQKDLTRSVSKLSIHDESLPSDYQKFVSRASQITAELLVQFQPILHYFQWYYQASLAKREKMLTAFSQQTFKFNPNMYRMISNSQQLLQNTNIFKGFEPLNYVQAAMLNVFTRDFSLGHSMAIHRILIKSSDKVDTCLAVCLVLARLVNGSLPMKDPECFMCDSFKGLDKVDVEEFMKQWQAVMK